MNRREKVAKLAAMIARERDRHRNAVAVLAADRAAATASGDPAKVAKVTAKATEERQRHRHRVAALQTSIRDAS